MNNVDLNKYKDFVQAVTSKESNSTMVLNNKLIDLEKESGVNLALLMTGAIGMASEGGEFSEIVKNVFRNPWTMKLYSLQTRTWRYYVVLD